MVWIILSLSIRSHLATLFGTVSLGIRAHSLSKSTVCISKVKIGNEKYWETYLTNFFDSLVDVLLGPFDNSLVLIKSDSNFVLRLEIVDSDASLADKITM